MDHGDDEDLADNEDLANDRDMVLARGRRREDGGERASAR